LASGPRSGDAPVTVGGVESFLIVTPCWEVVAFVLFTMHVRDQPLVSDVTVFVSQFCVDMTPVGSQVKATVTLVMYHPVPQPPPLHRTVMGTALAEGTTTSIGAQTSTSARK
jgi:hypothetical protein